MEQIERTVSKRVRSLKKRDESDKVRFIGKNQSYNNGFKLKISRSHPWQGTFMKVGEENRPMFLNINRLGSEVERLSLVASKDPSYGGRTSKAESRVGVDGTREEIRMLRAPENLSTSLQRKT